MVSESILTYFEGGRVDQLLSRGSRYFIAFFLALLVSLILTPLARTLTTRLGMVDKPDPRRVNKVPIPRGGGLAVIAAFHIAVALLVFGLGGAGSFSVGWYWTFLAGSLFLAGIGFWDDARNIRPLTKLLAQILVATGFYVSGIHVNLPFFGEGVVSAGVEYAVTVLWVVGAVNAFNLIDGLDGLASGLACIASFGIAGSLLFANRIPETVPYLALAGACFGFLRYNFNPASVFLGDTGSMFLGLALATLPLVSSSHEEALVTLGVPLLAMGVPIIDTTLAIIRRTLRAMLHRQQAKTDPGGVKPSGVMQPDRDHLHHRLLVRMQGAQRSVVLFLYAASALLVSVGLLALLWSRQSSAIFLVAFVVGSAVLVRHMVRIELWDAGRLLMTRQGTVPIGRTLPIYLVADVLALSVAMIAARLILELPFSREILLTRLPIYVMPAFVLLCLSQAYRRVWSRALLRDYLLLFVAVATGGLLTQAARLFLSFKDCEKVCPVVLYVLIAGVLVVGMRLVRPAVVDIASLLERYALKDRDHAVRVLVYGGGVRLRSYVRMEQRRTGGNMDWIVGVVDDDPNLADRIVCGYPVCGSGDELDRVIETMRPGKILVSAPLTPARRRNLLAMAERYSVPVYDFVQDEQLAGEVRGDV